MLVSQVMTHDIYSIASNATVFEAADLLLATGVSAMPVVDDAGMMIGILSEADLIHRAEIGTEPHKSWFARMLLDESGAADEYVALHARRVTDVMTRKVVTVREDDTLARAVEVMSRHKVKRLPVCRGEEVVGIVSRSNLMRVLLSKSPRSTEGAVPDEDLRRNVQNAVDNQPWTSSWPINIVVSGGVVHLWGFVQNEAAATAYRVAAENVAGVARVKNHLRRMPSAVGFGV